MKENDRLELIEHVSNALAEHMRDTREQDDPQTRALPPIAANLIQMWTGEENPMPKRPNILCPFSAIVGMSIALASSKFTGHNEWADKELA